LKLLPFLIGIVVCYLITNLYLKVIKKRTIKNIEKGLLGKYLVIFGVVIGGIISGIAVIWAISVDIFALLLIPFARLFGSRC